VTLLQRLQDDGTNMNQYKIAGMNAQIVLSWVDFWTGTLMWKNGQNEAEHSTWMLLPAWLERPFTDGGANCPWHHQVRRRSRVKSLASMYVGMPVQISCQPHYHTTTEASNFTAVVSNSGRFVKQEQWERWWAKRKLLSGSEHRKRSAWGDPGIYPRKKILRLYMENRAICCSFGVLKHFTNGNVVPCVPTAFQQRNGISPTRSPSKLPWLVRQKRTMVVSWMTLHGRCSSYEKERLKRWRFFIRFLECADVTFCRRCSIHSWEGSNDWISSIAEGWEAGAADDKRRWRGRAETPTELDVRRLADLVSEVRRGGSMKVSVDQRCSHYLVSPDGVAAGECKAVEWPSDALDQLLTWFGV